MLHDPSRRRLLTALPTLGVALGAAPALFWRSDAQAEEAPAQGVHDHFPAQDLARVREIVGASHRDLERVQALLAESPDLAKATWDWGFGDWETALGAASHTGRREIAETLIAHGARPDLFTFTMLGHLDVVKALIAAQPGIQRLHGPHGLTLLHHARAGGEPAAAVLAFLEELGDADVGQTSAPMTDAEKGRYVGTYRYGSGAEEVLTVAVGRGDLLGVARGGDFPRTLFYRGEHTFSPAGTHGTRVRFELVDGQAVSLTVIDGEPVVTARRA